MVRGWMRFKLEVSEISFQVAETQLILKTFQFPSIGDTIAVATKISVTVMDSPTSVSMSIMIHFRLSF